MIPYAGPDLEVLVLRALSLLPALALLTACPPGMDPNIGTITVKNADNQRQELMLSQEQSCGLGVRTSIETNTITTFDVDKTQPTYVCMGQRPPGYEVKDGASYLIRGGRISETDPLQ